MKKSNLKDWNISSDVNSSMHIKGRTRRLMRRHQMKKAIIVYESVYGNTKMIAEAICVGMNKVEGVECGVKKTGELHTDDLCEFDAIVFGCPNHNQEPALNIMKFIDRASIVHLKAKIGAAFDTFTGGNKDVAVTKLEAKIREKLPGIELVDTLSAKVNGRKGPLADNEESKALDFGARFAKRLIE